MKNHPSANQLNDVQTLQFGNENNNKNKVIAMSDSFRFCELGITSFAKDNSILFIYFMDDDGGMSTVQCTYQLTDITSRGIM